MNGPFERSAEEAASLAAATRQALRAEGPIASGRPGFVERAGQLELAQAVAGAIAHRDTLVAEAGTGTGKTYAYLVPVLLAGARTLVSTGTRHLQDQLFARDLPAVREALGLDTSIAVLKGRSNYVCRHHLNRHRSDGRFADPATPDKLRRIERFAALSEDGDRASFEDLAEDDPVWTLATSTRENCLGQDCPELKQCFVFRARRLAQGADVVVVNHHLFCADLALRDEGIAELLPTADAVVFDEAHQLPEVATEFFGEAASTRQLLDLARDVLRAGLAEAADAADWRSLSARIERGARELRLSLGGSGPGGRMPVERLREMDALFEALEALIATTSATATILGRAEGRGPEIARCALRADELRQRLQRWRDAVWPLPADERADADSHAGSHVDHGADPDTASSADGEPAPDADAAEARAAVAWAEVGTHHASLRRTPLSVARTFRRHLGGPPRAHLFVSATLSVGEDFSHFTRALGLEDAHCARWPSPFDFAAHAALWVPRGLGSPSAPGFTERAVDAAWPLMRTNRGRAFFLCTTLRATRLAAEHLRRCAERDPGAGLVVLAQGDAPRKELLRRFAAARSGAVLVGSVGFWEGVDVSGDALSLVVIDKLPFAPPDDPVIRARSDALRRVGRDPFGTFQLPAAALMLKQGAGRLIRSETDRGVLVVCDERLVSRSYSRRLLAALPPFARVDDCERAAAYLPALPADAVATSRPATSAGSRR